MAKHDYHSPRAVALGELLSKISYPSSLPITAQRKTIITALRNHRVVIVTGETGSGKTTQIPKMCLEAGRGLRGIIGCTQPRRVAAVTVAHRLAEEFGEDIGINVAYKIRFEERRGAQSFIKIMTDGILLMELQGDPLLRRYDTIIVDEAHERNLNIDFVLGVLRTLLTKRRDLKVIITSATLDTEKFARAFAVPHEAVIDVSGRLYPVELRYRPGDLRGEQGEELSYIDEAVTAVMEIQAETPEGDVLVFMPTERDIRETCDRLTGMLGEGATVLPLYARLPWSNQRRVFLPVEGRKIIVATNIAETSLTIPNIRFVVDTGLARISQYNPRTKATSLQIRPISKSSADQRMGRCGRVRQGVCLRLYSEEDYEQRPLYTPPEILRANLAGVVLRMLHLRLGPIEEFPFIDRPKKKQIADAFIQLLELGAVVKDESSWVLTRRGKIMAELPLDPRISRILLESIQQGVYEDVRSIAAGLTVMDPRERPDEQAAQADQAHAPFVDPTSDFMTILRIWYAYQAVREGQGSVGSIRRFCRDHFLSFRRMREWQDIYEQLGNIVAEHVSETTAKTDIPKDRYAAVHKAVLSGYLSHIAVREERNRYRGARNREVYLFPGSGLYGRAVEWICAAEMVETSRLFARSAARVNPEWIEEVGRELCRYTYSAPRWDKEREEVVADEQVSIFGLVIVPRRTVSFGRINPGEARTIFVRDGLMTGELRSRFPFLHHNRELWERIRRMEEKTRRRDFLNEEAVFSFYAERLEGVSDVRGLRKLIRRKGGDGFLFMKERDILRQQPETEELAAFPDHLYLSGIHLPMSYRFAPGTEEDGVTLRVPVGVLTGLSQADIDWAVPGVNRERIMFLLKALPKEYRKKLPSAAEISAALMMDLRPGRTGLTAAMSAYISEKYHVSIPTFLWAVDRLPEHLKMRLEIIDGNSRIVAAGRDLAALRRETLAQGESAGFAEVRRRLERENLRGWDLGDIPESVPITIRGTTLGWAFPALAAEGEGVALRLFRNRAEAETVHLSGVRRLFEIRFSTDLRHLRKSLTLPDSWKGGAELFCGPKGLEKILYEKVCWDLFAKPIRTLEAFLRHGEEVRSRIIPRGMEVMELSRSVVFAIGETLSTLSRLEKAEVKSPSALKFLSSLRDELTRLIPADFLIRYKESCLPHICRYIKALAIRAVRGLMDLGKDAQKEAQVRRYEERLTRMREAAALEVNPIKTTALEEMVWTIAEYKVSLFAQELKTPYPVSPKRIEEKFKEIERL